MSNEYARKVLTSQKKELEIIVDSQPSGNDVRNQVVNINQLQQAINLLQSDVIASGVVERNNPDYDEIDSWFVGRTNLDEKMWEYDKQIISVIITKEEK